ncbi:MAG TPA: pyrimidine 5'-nucleotidase [Anaerolineales bacterium]|nr:pyrimidine 5'-nucleotidase [Anaerolineales bacterium]
MRFTTLFFDLDDTLYPPAAGLWEAIAARINLYMVERMGFPPEEAVAIRQKYFREFGTTLRGLQANHAIDTEDYLAFVHNVPLADYIHPDPGLRTAVETLPARKFIFTNADAAHANRVLKIVGLEGLFTGIIDVHAIAPYCKPMPEAFELALKAAGSPEPAACVLLDDQARITRAGRQLGMYTILVGRESANDDADAALLHLVDLPSLLGDKV